MTEMVIYPANPVARMAAKKIHDLVGDEAYICWFQWRSEPIVDSERGIVLRVPGPWFGEELRERYHAQMRKAFGPGWRIEIVRQEPSQASLAKSRGKVVPFKTASDDHTDKRPH